MAQPGILSSQIPPGEDHVMRALADIRREMRELGPSIMHSFQGVVDELAAHQATLDAQQATLTTTVADIAANVASINTLIGQVVVPSSIEATAYAFNVTTTDTTILTKTITVPDGFTKALVSVQSVVIAYNWASSYATLYTAIYINDPMTTSAGTQQDQVPNGGSSIWLRNSSSRVTTSLTPGSTFDIVVKVSTSVGPWGATSTAVVLDGTILWFR